MRAVAYCRFSSEQQRDGYSIEAQKRAIDDYCAREGYTLIDYYVDEARSATNDDRAAFQAMIADSSSKRFQAVIVHKLDRFARDRYDSAIYKKKLKDNGVRLISVLEPLDDSPESIMMESVLEGMAEYYSRNLSREVLKGKKESAQDAKHPGGIIPYGFDVDKDGHYIIVPEEAVVVKDIFEKAYAGYSFAAIARHLKEQGVKNRSGNRFMRESIARMIKNPLYKGTYTFGRRSKTGTFIMIEDAVVGIVSAEVWDKVNAEAEARADKFKPKKPSPRFKKDEYILTGYAYCAVCGSHLYGFHSHKKYKTAGGHDREYSAKFYRCARKVPRETLKGMTGGCDFKNIKKDELEAFVLRSIEEIIFSDSNLEMIVDKIKTRLNERINQTSDIAGLKNEIDKITRQQQRLLDLYLDGSLDIPTYNARKDELASSLEYYTDKLNKATVIKPEMITFDLVRSRIDAFLNSAAADSSDYKKLLLATFVDSVVLDNDQVVIYFKFSLDGLNDDQSFVCNRTQVSTSDRLRTNITIRVEFPISAVFDMDYSSGVMSIQM